MKLCEQLEKNIQKAEELLPLGISFDLIARELYIGQTKAYFLAVNGMCKSDLIQQLFSDLQNPLYTKDDTVKDLRQFAAAKIGYSQVTFTDSWDTILHSLLSGPSILLVDGFAEAVVIDARSYPTRGIEEPDTEKVTRGSRDGFVETLLFNTNLIRRRIRSPELTFEICSLGSVSQTDVSIAYLDHLVNQSLLKEIRRALAGLSVTSLTMGAKSLEELLVKKRWYNPLPSIQVTERPDVACSYLAEGHILILVDNSPSVLILPCTIFQFTQSPEDYYKSPSVGTYFRLVRFGCVLASLLLLPLFLLLTTRFPEFSLRLGLLASPDIGPIRMFFFVMAVEFALDLFKYSAAHSSSRFSGSLSVIGGLIIGDIAIEMNWASVEVIFYAAITLLTTLSLSSIEFGDAIRLYRIFLIATTGAFGIWGFWGGLFLVLLSAATTPTFAHMSYFWPLFPWNKAALKTLLFRSPTFLAQPANIWKRYGKKHHI